MEHAIMGRVADQLETLVGLRGAWSSTLATQSWTSPVKPERLRYQRCLLDELFEADQSDVAREGRSVVLTAGPPGAGKSTAVAGLVLDGWRVIDADDIKVRLLEDGRVDGRFSVALDTVLVDGFPVRLNELSTLVHVESARLADRMAERSIEAGENVVIVGTLSWPGTVEENLKRLGLHDYHDVRVIDVEVPRDIALDRAYLRWARGRQAAAEGRDPRGGRFTPRAAIESLYNENERHSRCNENAVHFFTSDAASVFETLELTVSADGAGPHVYKRALGEYLTAVPRGLNEQDVRGPRPQ
ncbi:hypothetical protein BKD30_03430 [Tersicoccus phoenicis]|uniref:UDP-N-acetylglucosamine kinase n=1 Tax=Tersicoccus phoenicis TaxID=554083 RepID=A0A1R1LJH9_9MICC|nr:AAA family ATPase [Tersicoccus phoenicis]OMH27705.1 hypothetical protein BKD30_03430 [Tersicoccus phoenicis]